MTTSAEVATGTTWTTQTSRMAVLQDVNQPFNPNFKGFRKSSTTNGGFHVLALVLTTMCIPVIVIFKRVFKATKATIKLTSSLGVDFTKLFSPSKKLPATLFGKKKESRHSLSPTFCLKTEQL
jgi:hypothetical protein